MMTVTLVEVTRENLRAVLKLEVAPSQAHFVGTNAQSISEAHFAPEAWFRAIAADGELVGFVMLELFPEKAEYGLWRLLIDHHHQGRGYGKAAIALVCDFVRTQPGAERLITSYVPGEGSPKGFYEKLGFVPTGAMIDAEVVLALPLG